ncbi:nucleotidyltransferase family protein [Pelotomaculum propionicicum]|uniref:nucleotidyltransferase family protein n=1 Tax=Pelotomaculum propionicicum TaxID=258475 RepID=UPI003B7EAAF5
MISAIILAAGMSTRMGRPKQLLKVGNNTLIRILTENVLLSNVDELLVVTGYQQKKVSAVISDLPVKIVFNPRYKDGQGTSLALGVKSISDAASAFMVFMVDQPLITASLINKLMVEFQKRRCLALRPVCKGLPGHPVIFSSSLIDELKSLSGDEGARQVLKKLDDKVEYLAVGDEAVIFDIDTPKDYEKFVAEMI